MTGRQQAYFGFRGASAGLFMLSATVMSGPWAVVACFAAGFGGLLTCLGVNAGGPGERAGARVQQVQWDKTRAPQGDWPPYDPDLVVDGEIVP